MKHSAQPQDPEVDLLKGPDGEITLYIDGGETMQGWEQGLMEFSADLLCEYGTRFLEAGLGLGYSANHVARHAKRHTVVELYPRVIELYEQEHPQHPDNLEIVQGDFLEFIE